MFAFPVADPDEKDMVLAGIDNDGDLDLLVAIKESFYANGPRHNRAFLNN